MDYGLEDGSVCRVCDTVSEREVDGVVFARANTDISKFACSGEVLTIFVEGARHDSVGCVEGLLNTISVVYINVDVKNALMESEKFDNAKNDILKILSHMLSAQMSAL